jgi:hypothetical protein
MPVERREQVTRVEIVRVNGQPEELAGFGGRRQPSLGGTSRMNREVHVRFCERLGVKVPGATRQHGGKGMLSNWRNRPRPTEKSVEQEIV